MQGRDKFLKPKTFHLKRLVECVYSGPLDTDEDFWTTPYDGKRGV